MRPHKTLLTLLGLFFVQSVVLAQDNPSNESNGLPGEQFSLQGALQMFKNSTSVEDFEKALNTESNSVNNLDLNNDGDIDYIRVIDKSDDNAHALILQAIVSDKESQDVAVVEIEKNGQESAMLQIVGDEELYGEKIVIEPSGDEEKSGFEFNYGQGNYMAGGPSAVIGQQVFVNVWFWPSVRFIFAPAYRPWVSPWRWRHYPVWWRPWRPFGWSVWHPRCRVYVGGPFVVVGTHRVVRAHAVYMPYRSTSVIVKTRYAGPIGAYRVKTTRVTGPRGNKVIIRKNNRGNGYGPGGRGRKVKVRRF